MFDRYDDYDGGYDREDYEKEHEPVFVETKHFDAHAALEKEAEDNGYKHGWVWHRLNERFGKEIADALYNGYAELNEGKVLPE
jgi:hypothetical protein